MTAHTIGFIGMGLMGRPMSAHLAESGFTVNAWDIAPRDLLEVPGRTIVATIADACADADVVLTMLPDLPEVRQVCEAPDGVFASTSTAILLVMGTVSPAALTAWAPQSPLRVVDAPVSGGDIGAIEANLSIMVGGSDADVAEVLPILRALGTTVTHLGPLGSGQLAKACNQMVVATTMTVLGEAVSLARAGGLEVDAVLELLASGLAGSRALDVKRERLVSKAYEPGGRSDFQHKDLGLALDAARKLGVYVPVTAAVDQLFGAMRWTGHGTDDHSGVVQMIERLSGA